MSATMHNLLTIMLAEMLIGASLPILISGQNCNCDVGSCCSQYGYCGTGGDYCGTGCQAGPCWATPSTTTANQCGCDDGECCSQYGYCGTGDAYCGTGCQAGPCWATPSTTTTNQCGCDDGECCSQYGYCGIGNDYCGTGCQAGPCWATPSTTTTNKCGCDDGECCSQYGYCGTGDDYCGTGCQAGPCSAAPSTSTTTGLSVSDIVTEEFFNGITNQADASCPGKGFYTRSVFLEAAASQPLFGQDGSTDVRKQEIAAAFAHFSHETTNFCYIEEKNGPSKNYCDTSDTGYPCVPGKGYYGRGAIQLSWNYNYGPAGKAVGFDGLNNPDIMAADPLISFKATLWDWMRSVHSIIVSGQGFGATIRDINGPQECDGGNTQEVNDRVQYYIEYCKQLGVSPGDNLYC